MSNLPEQPQDPARIPSRGLTVNQHTTTGALLQPGAVLLIPNQTIAPAPPQGPVTVSPAAVHIKDPAAGIIPAAVHARLHQAIANRAVQAQVALTEDRAVPQGQAIADPAVQAQAHTEGQVLPPDRATAAQAGAVVPEATAARAEAAAQEVIAARAEAAQATAALPAGQAPAVQDRQAAVPGLAALEDNKLTGLYNIKTISHEKDNI